MRNKCFASSDIRKANKTWRNRGGKIAPKFRTGELRYSHPEIDRSIIISANRKDTPRVLKVALHKLMQLPAANDPVY